MSVQIPPNSTGSVIDTQTTVGNKERQVTIPPIGGIFNINHTPAAATQATISQAAAGAGVSNVCTRIGASISTVGTAQTLIQINLRDGATGAGTILWSKSVQLATNSMLSIDIQGLYIQGSANTPMTLEFSAAGVAASVESVQLGGVTNG